MRTNKLFYILLCSVLLTITACDFINDDFTKDPNNPTSVTPGALLTSIETSIAYTQGGEVSRYTSIFIQSLKGIGRQHEAYNRYIMPAETFNNIWSNYYSTALEDIQQLKILADGKGYKAYAGIAKALEAYTIGTMTDLWGGLPYSNAFKGTDNLQPTYDSQEEIYAKIQELLTAAKADLSGDLGDITPDADDFIYEGNTDRWLKFVNVLSARYYLHLSKKDASNAQKAIEAIGTAGFETTEDDAKYAFGNSETAANPAYQFLQQRAGDITYADTYLTDKLDAMNDPRLEVYVDMESGDLASFYGSINSPVFFLTYAEQNFILAEAYVIKSDLVKAKQYYDIGVKAAMKQVGVPESAAAAYPFDVTKPLETIMLQKYFALFLQPESFVDWRRTGYPAITPNSGTEIPRRFTYPQSELDYNSANVPKPNTLFDKVWWEQ
ncbi:SusD/RagB family nutrient-binding outer membrane lipoprotein [Cytophagaceae bacterium YF14B1]|uniref:SusD/RagB family nutrient-binding outer membrane lipoprotein n=1 Tax=Xanthocytophaga flava TaxID=3048013 RepID=A0AAE3QI69_9BACT|nr:SusD/RagB family nutrient-binding outer membrane lipoprotein [Xanthocytophaga flavus]MDJ1479817.1 SusD/RagB family nutrient-binding outer membrane lipoprotein [Xanthocytophaga flavus]